jgi:hypothetical protein
MIKSFDSFVSENYSHYSPLQDEELIYPYGADFFDVEDLLKVHESNAISNLSLSDFKSIFYAPLVESEGYFDHSLVESLHACYEFSQMYESRPGWFSDPDVKKFMMESDTHYIYLCNGEVYTISKKSFETIETLNEGFMDWMVSPWKKAAEIGTKAAKKVGAYISKKYDETKVVVKKVVNKAGEVVKKIKDTAADVWNTISDGAKKAWKWCKDSVATIWNIVKSMSPLEMASGVISIVGAAAGWLAEFGGTILAAICTALSGGIGTYTGAEKTFEGANSIRKAPVTADKSGSIIVASLIPPVKSAIPLLVGGVVSMTIGLHDISTGIAESLVNPAAGTMGLAISAGARKVADSWIVQTIKRMDGFMEEILGKILQKIGGIKIVAAAAGGVVASVAASKVGSAVKTAAATKAGNVVAKAAESGAGEVTSKVSDETKGVIADGIQACAINQILGWLWDKVLKAGKLLTQGISFIIDIPSKISSTISNISKNAKGTIATILAQGLNSIVKPLTDVLSKLVDKFLKPKVEAAKNWIDRQIKGNQAVKEILEGKPSPVAPVPVTKPKSAIKVETLKANPEDLKKLKELPPLNKGLKKGAEAAPVGGGKSPSPAKKSSTPPAKKVKESLLTSSYKVMGFDDFNLAY